MIPNVLFRLKAFRISFVPDRLTFFLTPVSGQYLSDLDPLVTRRIFQTETREGKTGWTRFTQMGERSERKNVFLSSWTTRPTGSSRESPELRASHRRRARIWTGQDGDFGR